MKGRNAESRQSKEDHLLLARLEDKRRQAEDGYMITAGDFLDAHQRKLAEQFFRGGFRNVGGFRAGDDPSDGSGSNDDGGLRNFSGSKGGGVQSVFYGGYDEAERCLPAFLPDYAGAEDLGELLRVARVRVPGKAGGRELTHRDYLGSLLALGIDRAVTGDILVRGSGSALGPGADVIVKAEIADFIESNYDKAGRTNLEVEILPIDQLHIEPVRMEERRDTVASLRLDSIVASAFRLSRAKAAEAIRRGLVSVNSAETLKVDMMVEEGDRIVLRGQGKVKLTEVGGETRKDRIRIGLSVYR